MPSCLSFSFHITCTLETERALCGLEAEFTLSADKFLAMVSNQPDSI
jgi:hypothetical protein